MTRKYVMMLLLVLLSIMTAAADTASPRIFRNYTSADGLADNSAHTIHCTKTGRIVITTIGQINFFDGSKFNYIDPLDENVYPLPKYHGNYHLFFDKYHHMWLKNNQTVTCVDLLTERFVRSIEDEFYKFGMKDLVLDIFIDKTGVVWLLTDKGLYSVESKRYITPREKLNLQDVEVIGDNFVMLFYEDGLMEMYDKRSGRKVNGSRAYSEKIAELFNHSSLVLVDRERVLQIRNGKTDGILMQYDLNRNEWSELMRMPYHLNNMAKRDSLLYVPCEYGYWVYNLNTHESKHIEGLQMENGQVLETNINVITFDRQGGMWAGTEQRGLLYSRPNKSPFSVYLTGTPKASQMEKMMSKMGKNSTFRGRMVNCVLRDSRGWTWVGTTQGLQLYRRDKDMLPQVFTTKDGLYNNIIHSIVEDKQHRIWAATSYGISVLLFKDDGRLKYINSYNQYDHIPNEVFVNGKAMCMPDGEIVMQSLDHVIMFNPSKMSTLESNYPFKLYPKLVKLLVNGYDVGTTTEIDGVRILDRALSRTWAIDLNYDQNSLTLMFSALNYFRPQQTFYRVRIVGLDDEWRVMTRYNSGGMVDRNGMLHLPLMSLNPGSYSVQVQASMAPDVWDTKPYEWKIEIHEPWWRSTGLFVLLAVLVILLLLINLYYYMHNANLRAQRNSEELGLIKRIYIFVEHCNDTSSEILEPTPEEFSSTTVDEQNELDPKFLKVIKKIMPVVLGEKKKKMTMRRLSNAAGMDAKEFYTIITANIFKSPRPIIKQARIMQAERMLRNTKEPVDEIAKRCGFVSANYLISSFYQVYHLTPIEYRRKR